ncbi:RBD2 Rhomboid protein 2 [Candida maltosa Xu316]
MIDFNTFPPTIDSKVKPPALTIGLAIFTFILCSIRTFTSYDLSSLVLYPRAPLDFNLNSLSFYSMVHVNFFHWICNIITLAPPLAIFEMRNGTVYSGVTLNLLTVIAGLQYCLVGMFLYPNTGVVGLSGIAFSIMAYMAYQESKFKPIFYIIKISSAWELKIYTLYVPFLIAIVFMIFFPSSSLPGHLTGITTGYLLSYGYLNIIYPPSRILIAIEQKISGLINLLNKIVTWYKEDESVQQRDSVSDTYIPLFSQSVDIEESGNNSTPARYVNETRILGGGNE